MAKIKNNTTASKPSLSFYWPLSVLLLTLAATLVAILWMNNGLFIFTADDAYVHFKMAANLLTGTYGINQGEFAAPCSTILWPFMLAPLTLLPGFVWIILGLNLLIVVAIIRVQFYIITGAFSGSGVEPTPPRKIFATFLLIALLFISNAIPLLFSGMEYVWQVLLIHLILLGLIQETQNKCPGEGLPAWLLTCLILAPLMRYESLAVTLPALIYLFLRGYRARSLLAGLTTIACLALFAVFLCAHGAGPLPTSITAKMLHQVGLGGPLETVLRNFLKNITNLFNLPLFFLTCVLLPVILFQRYRQHRGLAGILLFGSLLHFIFGHITFLCRHEAYLLSALALATAYIYTPDLLRLLGTKTGRFVVPAGTGLLFIFLSWLPLAILGFVPTMSNMAYRHPYQLHRLVTQFYRHPVAANDIGWICFGNDQYVLDVWGAASEETLACGCRPDSLSCISALAKGKNIRLVIITNSWFRNIPTGWIKIGDYHRGRDPLIIEKLFGKMLSQVDVYVTDTTYIREAVQAILKFRHTLPASAYFHFVPYIEEQFPESTSPAKTDPI